MNNSQEKVRPASPGISPLLSLPEAAAYLDVAEQTLYAWRSRGEGPAGLRIGGRVKFRRADLDAWIEQAAQADAERVAKITR